MTKTPKEIVVTVCMTAFNQAQYIVDAIEGVLMQTTNFDYELLIGEDCSAMDNTLEICRNYAKKYPQIIKVIHDGKNHGMVANEQRLIDLAQGKYIAFCEADDYWIDPLKLQKQVDILDKNPDYSASACQSRVIFGKDKENYHLLSKSSVDKEISLTDILVGNYGFQTASFIFRKANFENIKPMPKEINGWDRAVFMLNAFRGNIYWFKDAMAVYRKNEGGISTWVTYNLMKKDINMVSWFQSNIKDFPIKSLKAHIYDSIIANARNISTFNLINYSFRGICCVKTAESNVDELKVSIHKTLEFRLPKLLRKTFIRIGIVKHYA